MARIMGHTDQLRAKQGRAGRVYKQRQYLEKPGLCEVPGQAPSWRENKHYQEAEARVAPKASSSLAFPLLLFIDSRVGPAVCVTSCAQEAAWVSPTRAGPFLMRQSRGEV